ncbi:nitroreductase family deazaflavin-dependent oxidoreductase [Oceanicoccus sp. KOV_DT_Chl]|uniref:nitroreductase family deazaflavin-dependent oxidoreductase n=1 Tax=Oceanicoccus sp. KOV_DT_Chl TaxID=1904639 RepID=UPI000C7D02A6|nr:nitroreductase family deazaflavin-dependent oxidoreductase [Oceanicoccus sp. KOV_DT_Chl]
MANFLWFSKLHSRIYQATDGRIGATLWHPMVLMHTIGAKSNCIRTVPVQYYPLADNGIIIIASNNGQIKPPAWWFNLQANPTFNIQVGREKRRVTAEQLSAQKRAEIWPQIRKLNSAVDRYKEKSGRNIPVILLRTLATVAP